MKAQILKTLALAISLSAISTSFAFNPKDIHNETCLNCHKDNGANYSHDNNFYESRSLNNIKLKSFADLKAQINRCSNYYDSAWFPEEEAEIVKYLNDEYYQFIMNAKAIQARNSY
ncbi:hypothetical protein [Candidatus Thioglobus sp.]|jgi:hypothetical protein|uniref:hypothetical protein n=1 Tax=Candidatus Thioglobus sp. TaxID=2026721 RepID=UPI001D54190C|nr:hypothetical protein [Candidatus Thioglobus sp.]MBT3276636.1 hypothetical protein [Candidatus Thioglobus sp.]MBT3447369.1 hypothetical protein [Candidatus Thioglobus sp.]MBT4000664.1 hypothetical protein [Candidatus Thioglobus sp.]MBT4181763.1 hypothetical protein [Candidatus Thioglobus sp.]MBT4422437.1 hypothetical protein [Candidatus Thioglobus sp.]